MVTILAGLATFERHLIKARTAEGRIRAKARGIRFGRKLKLTKYQIDEALQRRASGERLRDIARPYGVSHSLGDAMTDGFHVKQNDDTLDVRCYKCGARWSNDEEEWLAKLLEHAMQHFEQRDATHGAAEDRWKFYFG